MTTTAAPSAHAVIMSPMCQSAKKPGTRYFDMLDSDDSRERVTALSSRYRQLLPAEKLAFLQELIGPGGQLSPETDALLHRVLAREEAECAVTSHVTHYTSPRLVAVQARDPGFISTSNESSAPVVAGESQDNASTHVGKIASLLDERGLFGECDVRRQVERLSMYDRIQSRKESHVSAAEAAANRAADATGSAEGSRPGTPAACAASHALTSGTQPLTQGRETTPCAGTGADGQSASALHRSRAYQTLRLAHSFPHHINTTTADDDHLPTTHILNLSGIPIAEDELRLWFDAMDTDRTGALNCQEFLAWMRCLERDFGAQATYPQLVAEGMRLSQDNKLGFEAFAYLVLRFVAA